MPKSTKSKRLPSLGEDTDNLAAMSSMDPDLLTLVTNQMKNSLGKKNKIKNAKTMRAARSELEKLLSTRMKLVEKERGELASLSQDYSAGYAQDLDEIRGHWMSIAQLLEALLELLSNEEKMAHNLELDREKISVTYLAQAKADCEEQSRIIESLD